MGRQQLRCSCPRRQVACRVACSRGERRMTRGLGQRSQWWPILLPRRLRLPRSYLQHQQLRRHLCLALLQLCWPVGMQRCPVAPRAQRIAGASLVEGATMPIVRATAPLRPCSGNVFSGFLLSSISRLACVHQCSLLPLPINRTFDPYVFRARFLLAADSLQHAGRPS